MAFVCPESKAENWHICHSQAPEQAGAMSSIPKANNYVESEKAALLIHLPCECGPPNDEKKKQIGLCPLSVSASVEKRAEVLQFPSGILRFP